LKTRIRPQKDGQGSFALVSTLMIIAVMAVGALAFFQAARMDRVVSRNTADLVRAQLAAESGLADASAKILQGVGSNFQYFSGQTEEGGLTFLSSYSFQNGIVTEDGSSVDLVSSSSTGSNTTILVDPAQSIRRSAGWVSLSNGFQTNLTARYAYWADDNSAAFNPAMAGAGSRLPLATNCLPFPYRTGGGNSFELMSKDSLAALTSRIERSVVQNSSSDPASSYSVLSWPLATVRSLNLLLPSPGEPHLPYDVALQSFADVAAPSGLPKVNLAALKAYADGLSQNQEAGNEKALLVGNLLNNPDPAWQRNITVTNAAGVATIQHLGGNFSFLTNRYTDSQARQFLANLIDYLDADKIPTTDNVDNPTYFGVECWPVPGTDGTVAQGHPYINFVAGGLVMNWGAGTGRFNSTRVLVGISLVNPWSFPINLNLGTTYRWDLEFRVGGTVTGGALGSQADSYFRRTFNPSDIRPPSEMENGPTVIGARSGEVYPNPPLMGNNNIANFNDLIPLNMVTPVTLQNLTLVPIKVRLAYTTNNWADSNIVAIANLARLTNSMVPANVVSPGGSGSTVIFFNRPGSTTLQNWHLQDDPRLAHLTNTWRLARSTTAAFPVPQDGRSVFEFTNASSDPPQGLSTSATWYTSAGLTNHFTGHLNKTNTNAFSIGELGFLSTGQSWKTLNLTDTNPPLPNTEDWRVLDYVTSGQLPEEPVHLSWTTNTLYSPRGRVVRGQLNPNARKYATWLAWMDNAGAGADTVATEMAGLGREAAHPCIGAVFTNAWVDNFGPADQHTQRENAVRALADGLATASRTFTVYSMGQSLSKNGRVTARSLLQTEVMVETDPASGQPSLRVLSRQFR